MRTDFVFKGVWLSESLQGAVPIGYPSSKNILVGRSEPRKGSCGAAALGSEGDGRGGEEGNVPYFLQGRKLDLSFSSVSVACCFPSGVSSKRILTTSTETPLCKLLSQSSHHIGGSAAAGNAGCHKVITVLITFKLDTYKYANNTHIAM